MEDRRVFLTCILLSMLVGGAAGWGAANARFNDAQPGDAGRTSSSTSAIPAVLGALGTNDHSDEQQTEDVTRLVSPAVVSISIAEDASTIAKGNSDDPFSDLFNDQTPTAPSNPRSHASSSTSSTDQKVDIGGGSGFFVSSDGYIVTNKHVVSDPNATYTVITQDGKTYPAKVLALDPSLDLAIVKVDGQNFPYLQLGDSNNIVVGQTVIAIGNALDEFQNTVTKGIISGVNRRLVAGDGETMADEVIEQAIQTDAAINFGNSGGPLLNLDGQVIGVNTAISQDGQSLGFALPINVVKSDIESVRQVGRIVRPWLGVRYVQIDSDLAQEEHLPYTYGDLVGRGTGANEPAVIPGSPADKAGIKENDIILAVNGQQLNDNNSLTTIISQMHPGDKVTLQIARAGQEKTITVTLEERKADVN